MPSLARSVLKPLNVPIVMTPEIRMQVFGHSIEESPFFIYMKANFGIGVLCVCVWWGGEELAVRET